jgi:TIR domain
MPTLSEYFKTDFHVPVRLDADISIQIEDEVARNFESSTLVDFNANAKYIAMYFDASITDGRILISALRSWKTLLDKSNHTQLGRMLPAGLTMEVQNLGPAAARISWKWPGDSHSLDLASLHFTGRVFLYTENNLPAELAGMLEEVANEEGLSICYRGHMYAIERDRLEEPRAFISHDSRDKEEIARKIATRLREMLCPVWYDEFSLRVGDSLRESIEDGLKKYSKCVFVITPNFLSKGGWPKREYQSVFTRELVEESKLILPVWSNVTQKEVFDYSPVLADRVALDWSVGEEDVCKRLFSALS